jgi:hypothetical protein
MEKGLDMGSGGGRDSHGGEQNVLSLTPAYPPARERPNKKYLTCCTSRGNRLANVQLLGGVVSLTPASVPAPTDMCIMYHQLCMRQATGSTAKP